MTACRAEHDIEQAIYAFLLHYRHGRLHDAATCLTGYPANQLLSYTLGLLSGYMAEIAKNIGQPPEQLLRFLIDTAATCTDDHGRGLL